MTAGTKGTVCRREQCLSLVPGTRWAGLQKPNLPSDPLRPSLPAKLPFRVHTFLGSRCRARELLVPQALGAPGSAEGPLPPGWGLLCVRGHGDTGTRAQGPACPESSRLWTDAEWLRRGAFRAAPRGLGCDGPRRVGRSACDTCKSCGEEGRRKGKLPPTCRVPVGCLFPFAHLPRALAPVLLAVTWDVRTRRLSFCPSVIKNKQARMTFAAPLLATAQPGGLSVAEWAGWVAGLVA